MRNRNLAVGALAVGIVMLSGAAYLRSHNWLPFRRRPAPLEVQLPNSTKDRGTAGKSAITDSRMTLEQALAGQKIPPDMRRNLVLIEVTYLSFDGKRHRGQIVVHRDLEAEVKAIFAEIEASRFPIDKMVPISKYAWSDEASMADNNTSAFNYRKIQGQRILSEHAQGRAIDINPRLNPCIKDGVAVPAGAKYQTALLGTVRRDGPIVMAFRKRGWKWGGDWNNLKDWQHFEKKSEKSRI